ncbi:MAG: hypothetical protein ACUVRM_08380, partial [Bacillota bacterium]
GLFGVSEAVSDTATQSVTMTVNEIAVIDVAGGNVTLTITAPTQGGAPPANPTNNSTYLQYTSTVPTATTRKITAAFGATDAPPTGTSLKLSATVPAGMGTAAPQLTLSSTAGDLVTGIGSVYTGTGTTNGAQLNYTLSIDNFSQLVVGESKTVTVTFTLTDAA